MNLILIFCSLNPNYYLFFCSIALLHFVVGGLPIGFPKAN